jgi:hypothetical protein
MSAFPPLATSKADMLHMVMSALHLKADVCGASRNVRFGPKADFGGQQLARPNLRMRLVAESACLDQTQIAKRAIGNIRAASFLSFLA